MPAEHPIGRRMIPSLVTVAILAFGAATGLGADSPFRLSPSNIEDSAATEPAHPGSSIFRASQRPVDLREIALPPGIRPTFRLNSADITLARLGKGCAEQLD